MQMTEMYFLKLLDTHNTDGELYLVINGKSVNVFKMNGKAARLQSN